MAKGDAVAEATAAAAGSVLALLATYPLKTIYTLQALHGNSKYAAAGGSPAALSVLDVIRRYKLQGLYIGIEPNIFESAVSSAAYFFLYNKLKAWALGLPGHAPRASSNSPGAPQTAASTSGSMSVFTSLLVAAVAGAGNQLLTLPASVLATRLQAEQKRRHDKAQLQGTTPRPVSALSTARHIYSEGGLSAFWQGLVPALVLVANPAIQYMVYEQLLQLLQGWRRKRAAAEAAAAAAKSGAKAADGVAGASQAKRIGVVSAALERAEVAEREPVASQEQQQQPDSCTNENHSCSGEGNGQLSKRRVPGEQIGPVPPPEVAASDPGGPSARLSPGEIFLASAAAKVAATVATYPLIVIKSRLQAGSSGGRPYRGTVDVVVRTLRTEGVRGFFAGLEAKIFQTALNAALMLMLKEQLHLVVNGLLQPGAPAHAAVGAVVQQARHLVVAK